MSKGSVASQMSSMSSMRITSASRAGSERKLHGVARALHRQCAGPMENDDLDGHASHTRGSQQPMDERNRKKLEGTQAVVLDGGKSTCARDWY